jgi:hypothetical protein
VELEPIDEPALGPLPRRHRDGEWTPEARATWEAWRQDPATTRWTPADVGFAVDTLYLVDECALKPRAPLAAEVRLRMDALGLTPKGRRYLRWRIAEPAEVVDHPSAAGGRTRARRRRLRAVDDE